MRRTGNDVDLDCWLYTDTDENRDESEVVVLTLRLSDFTLEVDEIGAAFADVLLDPAYWEEESPRARLIQLAVVRRLAERLFETNWG